MSAKDCGSNWLLVAAVLAVAFVAGMVFGSWGTSAMPARTSSGGGDGSVSMRFDPLATALAPLAWTATPLPTATVTPSPTPKPTPQPTATAQPVCNDDTAFGAVCVQIQPTIRQPRTVVWCTPEWSGLCRWVGAPEVSARSEVE